MAMIVIRSKTTEIISKTCCFEYSLHTASRTSSGELIFHSKLIDRKRAKEIIEKKGLIESYRTGDGEIYDTPEGDFKSLFPEGIHTIGEKILIERADKI